MNHIRPISNHSERHSVAGKFLVVSTVNKVSVSALLSMESQTAGGKSTRDIKTCSQNAECLTVY